MCTEARVLSVRTTESAEGQSGQGSAGAKASGVARVPHLRKRELLVRLGRVTREARARGGGQDPLPSVQLVWSSGPYWRCMRETWSSLLCVQKG